MAKITFVQHDGTETAVEAKEGWSLMELARDNGVPGIDADCGGQCACATCHIFIAEPWLGKLGAKSEMEDCMLDMIEHLRPTSRLACQIKYAAELNGMTVELPVSQH